MHYKHFILTITTNEKPTMKNTHNTISSPEGRRLRKGSSGLIVRRSPRPGGLFNTTQP